MPETLSLLRFLLEAQPGSVALLSVTAIFGGGARAVGAQMAVRADGAAFGTLSGGCVEAAIIGEARRVIASGRPESIRIGQGSRMMDLRLPCGGGMDVLITPLNDFAPLRQAHAALQARQEVTLRISPEGGLALIEGDAGTGWAGPEFQVALRPALRLVIAGQGAEALALARLGAAFGAGLCLLSPRQEMLDAAIALGAEVLLWTDRRHPPALQADRHSAIVLLFHDHEWEAGLLQAALASDAFYIGAMGSRATQARRLQGLAAQGVAPAALARLTGPIGLIPAVRDPELLALSALGEIAARHQAACAGSAPSLLAAAS